MWPAPQISISKVTLEFGLSSHLLHDTNRIHKGTHVLPPKQHWHEEEQGIMAGPVAVTREP